MTEQANLTKALTVVSLLALVGALWFPLLSADVTAPGWLSESLEKQARGWLVGAGLLPPDIYLLDVLGTLFRRGEYLLAVVVLSTTLLLPAISVLLVGWLALGTFRSADARERAAGWLIIVARWSMLDVFVVALVIALFTIDALRFHFSAGFGTYCCAAVAILSAIAGRVVANNTHTFKEPRDVSAVLG